MKNLKLFTVAVASVLVFACKPAEIESPVNPEGQTVSVTLTTAPFEDSKTYLTAGEGCYIPKWSGGEEMGMLLTVPQKGDTKTYDLTATTVDGTTATFTGILSGVDNGTYTIYGYTPRSAFKSHYFDSKTYTYTVTRFDIPEEQTMPADIESIDPAADLLIAYPQEVTITDGVLNVSGVRFARPLAILKVNIRAAAGVTKLEEGEVIKSVSITAPSGTGLIQYTRISIEDYNRIYDISNKTNKNTVTSKFAEGSEKGFGNDLWFVVNPVTIPAGSELQFTVLTDKRPAFTKSVTLANELQFESGKVKGINVTFDDSIISDISGSGTEPEDNPTAFKLVTSASQLNIGDEFIIVNSDKAAGTTLSSGYFNAVDVTVNNNNTVTLTSNNNVQIFSFAAKSGDKWTITKADDDTNILKGSSNGNLSWSNSSYGWEINIDATSNEASIKDATYTSYYIQYNTQSPRFKGYTGTGKNSKIYSRKVAPEIKVTGELTKNIAWNAEDGEIDFTVKNPIEGHTVTATANVDWITIVDTDNATTLFEVTPNTASSERTGTITLSYEGATDVTVTIKQAGKPADSITIASIENNAVSVSAAEQEVVSYTVSANQGWRSFNRLDGNLHRGRQ